MFFVDGCLQPLGHVAVLLQICPNSSTRALTTTLRLELWSHFDLNFPPETIELNRILPLWRHVTVLSIEQDCSLWS